MTAFYVWLKTQVNDLCNNEKGVTIVEYVLMIALVALAVALGSPSIRDVILQVFTDISSAIVGASAT